MTQYLNTAASTVEAFWEKKGFGSYKTGGGCDAMLREFSPTDYILVTGLDPNVPDELFDPCTVTFHSGDDDGVEMQFRFKDSLVLSDMPEFKTMDEARQWFTQNKDRAVTVKGV